MPTFHANGKLLHLAENRAVRYWQVSEASNAATISYFRRNLRNKSQLVEAFSMLCIRAQHDRNFPSPASRPGHCDQYLQAVR